MPQTSSRSAGTGVALAVVSAATFGTSGTFATSLIDAGWDPAAAVISRLAMAALVLTVPACLQLRRCWPELRARGPAALRTSALLLVVYGLVAVAGAQFFFFNALHRLQVGVALLLEYLGTILVVLWMWLRHGQRPHRLTLAGSVAAFAGLLLVLGLTGGQRPDPIGVLWGLGAAVGLAVFFVLSARTEEPLPPVVMTWAAMAIGALALLALGAVGALPARAVFGPVQFAGHRTSWLVPVLGLSLVAAALAYVAGIAAARRLGATLSSFLGLTEVLFAVLFAWAFLGQLPSAMQLAGGALILAGVALVRVGELRLRQPVEPPTAAPTAPALRLLANEEPSR